MGTSRPACAPSSVDSLGPIESADGAPRWLAVAAVGIFLLYAVNFLYFFVDDEAIPYVYAQNVLRGKGLTYNALEGRIEGYSDFLHIGLSTVILAIVRAARLPKLSVFFIGKAVSLLCGAGIVLLVWNVLRRSAVRRAGTVTGLAFVALAGPLAVWSCSSLEAAPFALVSTALVATLVTCADTAAALAASVLILERIDGFVYAGALIGAFIVVADAPRRREMVRRIVVPVSMVFVIYHAWRAVYFGDLVPTPLEAKILYKLTGPANLVVKAPDSSYLARFAGVYGWPAAIAFVASAFHAIRHGGVGRALGIAAGLLLLYLSIVGDWMFGFRFFVPLLPVIALIVAIAIGAMATKYPRTAASVSLVTVIYCGVVASRFIQVYTKTVSVPSFLRAPSRDLHYFFWSYYGLYETARRIIPRGEIVAYNQAGFVPFMLDLDNIDDLGICSRFHAKLPTTDMYFTEVGRYAPLTNKSALRVSDAYLLYRNARFVIARTDLLYRANHDAIPRALLGGYYERVGMHEDGKDAIYRRTDKPAELFARDPGAFVENLAHVSYLRRASIDGTTIEPRDYQERLRFLHDEANILRFTGRFSMDVQFGGQDEGVREIFIDDVHANQPSTLHLKLQTAAGHVAWEETLTLEPDSPHAVQIALPAGTTGNRLVFDLSVESGRAAVGWLSDLRVQGQTPALGAYIRRTLRFPAPMARPDR